MLNVLHWAGQLHTHTHTHTHTHNYPHYVNKAPLRNHEGSFILKAPMTHLSML